MPKLTWAFASERASANAGVTDSAAATKESAKPRIMTGLRQLYPFGLRGRKAFATSAEPSKQSMCHENPEEKRAFHRTGSFLIYELSLQLASGGRGPRICRAAVAASFLISCAASRRPRRSHDRSCVRRPLA